MNKMRIFPHASAFFQQLVSCIVIDVDDPDITFKGIQIQAGSSSQRGILRIAATKIAVYPGYSTSQTATYGATGTMRVVYRSDSSGTWWYDYNFINGLLVSQPHTS